MVDLYNRVLNLPTSRVASEVFSWDFHGNGEWTFKILEFRIHFPINKSGYGRILTRGLLYTNTGRNPSKAKTERADHLLI